MEASSNKKRKKKKKKKVPIESDSEDSDSTVIYSENLLDFSTKQEESLTDLNAMSLGNDNDDMKTTENSSERREKNIFTEKPKSHSGEFECICGSDEFKGFRGRKKRKHKVQCVVCGLLQHAECVNYDLKDPYRGEFKCPHCHVESVSFKFLYKTIVFWGYTGICQSFCLFICVKCMGNFVSPTPPTLLRLWIH